MVSVFSTRESVPRSATASGNRPVAVWLLICAVMILVMVVLGGVTRLTHSGLSIVEWHPVSGIVPPMNEAAWEELFRHYKQFPEYKKLNTGMTLTGFKGIFWLEFLHRFWGRLIGLAFLLPFLYFAWRRQLPSGFAAKLLGIFILGAMQGVMGWLMVKSGLVDRPDVSQYRLTAHLGLAFLLYAYILWLALGQLFPRAENAGCAHLRIDAWCLLMLVAFTVLAGGLVAGLDAGFAYNTFPLMAGQWIPEHLFDRQPWFVNFFENLITVQFTHRVLASLTAIGVLVFYWRARGQALQARTWTALTCLLLLVVGQYALGVATLLNVVPVSLGAAHQTGALLLFTGVLWVVHELRKP
jgi:heme a synthase